MGKASMPELELAAADALVKLTTCTRDVPYEAIKDLVDAVMLSSDQRLKLPILIVYLRNHNKSLAPGVGVGEKMLSHRVLCALFEADAPMGIALLKDVVLYGSWRSALQLLQLTDQLAKISSGDDYHPSHAHRFAQLQVGIHTLFANQLKADEESVAKGGGVTNASKYAPHEGRGGNVKYHADCIAKLLFPSFDLKSGNEHTLRRLYRQLRAKLNAANNHIAEIFLAGWRAEELKPNMICAGPYTKQKKALLNLNKKGRERHADAGRQHLRERILAMLKKNPGRLPAPSDLAQLAEQLLALRHDDDADEGERTLLRASYANAVRDLRQGVERAAAEAREVVRRLDLGDDERAAALAEAAPRPLAVAIDCSLSQRHTHAVSCLLTLLLADAQRPAAPPPTAAAGTPDGAGGDTDGAGADPPSESLPDAADAGGDGGAGERALVILFGEAAKVLDVPLAGPIEDRLAALHQAARDHLRDPDPDPAAATAAGGAPTRANYGAALAALGQAEFAGRDLVLCSDFQDAEGLAAAVREWRESGAAGAGAGAAGRAVSCWRMMGLKEGRVRGRRPAWDPARPRVDVAICMDTTGSMGQWIELCKREVQAILAAVAGRTGMAVRCSFVSYKDFGDAGHLEVFPWADAADAARMAELRAFVGALRASGGGDAPEDVAGGLEAVGRLFDQLAEPSIRLCLLVADAPAHGLAGGSGDSHVTHGGVDQKDRALQAVRRTFADGGAELLFARAGPAQGTNEMVRAFDGVLGAAHTFVDEFEVAGSSDAVFREAVAGALHSCVAAAVVPATEGLGVDCFAGTDLAVPLNIAAARLRDSTRALAAGLAATAAAPADTGAAAAAEAMAIEGTGAEAAAAAADSESVAVTAAVDPEPGTVIDEAAAPAASGKAELSALELLDAKLQGEEYDIVRATMGAVREGCYASYEWSTPLAALAINALIQAGVTEDALRLAGYPDPIVNQLRDALLASLAKGGSGAIGKRGRKRPADGAGLAIAAI